MILKYDGWCRRIDLNFRSRYPYLNTRIFKLNDYEYQIFVIERIEGFSNIAHVFNHEIRYMTAPVELVSIQPKSYQSELEGITDESISSKFEGFPFTLNQIYNHVASIHPDIEVSKISQDHQNRIIVIEVVGNLSKDASCSLQGTVDALKGPYSCQVNEGGTKAVILTSKDEVFNIASSQSKKFLNCSFLERDEKLWFENVDRIYEGTFSKEDLYFFNPDKTSCLVNFSKFKNANLRNHLLLYDVVYCVLPLAQIGRAHV